MVSIMAVAVIISLFYFGLWEPIETGIDSKKKQLTMRTRQLQNIQQQAAEARQLKQGQPAQRRVTNSTSLLSVIDTTSRQKNLKQALQKFQPEGDDSVRLWLEDAPFDALVEWLDLLNRQHGVSVSEISLEKQPESGLVDGRILLQVSS